MLRFSGEQLSLMQAALAAPAPALAPPPQMVLPPAPPTEPSAPQLGLVPALYLLSLLLAGLLSVFAPNHLRVLLPALSPLLQIPVLAHTKSLPLNRRAARGLGYAVFCLLPGALALGTPLALLLLCQGLALFLAFTRGGDALSVAGLLLVEVGGALLLSAGPPGVPPSVCWGVVLAGLALQAGSSPDQASGRAPLGPV